MEVAEQRRSRMHTGSQVEPVASLWPGGKALAPRPSSVWFGRASWWAVLLCLGCDWGAPGAVLDLPQRPSDAPGGAEVARDIRTLDLEAREERIYTEIPQGNVPTWLRRLQRVEVTGEVDGREHRVTFWVTPDYLAVGSDSDSFLVPLSPQVAQRIADLVGGSLPTPRMVDAIWASARVRLPPIRIGPDSLITTVRYFERHHDLKALIEDGKVTPVIDRSYPLSEVAEAIRYLEEGHARGKVVISV